MRRRASTGTNHRCAVNECAKNAPRKGTYCFSHQNQFAAGSDSKVATSPKKENEYFVCLSACQGHIVDGFCERHQVSARAKAIAEASTPKKRLPPSRGRGSFLAPTPEAGDSLGALPSFRKGGMGGKGGRGRQRAPSIVAMAANAKQGEETMERFLEAIHAISGELEAHKVADQIIMQACLLMQCERATLFYVDRDELVLMIAKGAKNIRLPKNKGLAGLCATTGNTINIEDAWESEHFDSSHDKSSGFRTKAVLATPIQDDEGQIVAVLQCINKKESFTFDDVVLIKNLAAHCSVVLRNAHLYEQSQRAEHKVHSLLEIVQTLHECEGSNTNSLIFTLSHRSHQLVDADRCTLYLVDNTRKQLVVMQGDVDIRIPMAKGIAGHVATTGDVVNIRECYQDPRFNQEIDKKTGYRTKSMLCMPIFAGNREVVGVLQLINKLDEGEFDHTDERILNTMLNIAGPILKKSSFFAKSNKPVVSELGRMRTPVRTARSPQPVMRGISE